MPPIPRPPGLRAVAGAFNRLVAAAIGTFAGGMVLAFAFVEGSARRSFWLLIGGLAGALACGLWITMVGKLIELAALLDGMPATARRVAVLRAFGAFAALVCLGAVFVLFFYKGAGGVAAVRSVSSILELAILTLILLIFAVMATSAGLRIPLVDLLATRVPEAPRDRLRWIFGAKPEEILTATPAPDLRPGETIVTGRSRIWRTSERLLAKRPDPPGTFVEVPIRDLEDIQYAGKGEDRWLVARESGGRQHRLFDVSKKASEEALELLRFVLFDRLSREQKDRAARVQQQLAARLEPGEIVRAAARACRRPLLMSSERADDAGLAVTDRRLLRFGPGCVPRELRLDLDDDIGMRPLGPNMDPWARWEITRWKEGRVVDRLIAIAHSDEAEFLLSELAAAARGPVSFLPPAFRLW